jgi:hypothetical protein
MEKVIMKRLLCKQTTSNWLGDLWVYEGSYYYSYTEDEFYYIICDGFFEGKELSFRSVDGYYNSRYIWDYFFTEKEMRKLKINNIEKCQL